METVLANNMDLVEQRQKPMYTQSCQLEGIFLVMVKF